LNDELSIPMWIGYYDNATRRRCITGPFITARAFEAKRDELHASDTSDVSPFRTRDNPRPGWHLISPSA
jgi:hypothetical protein